MPAGKNVLGTALEVCSVSPMTGFFRTGCCETGASDMGLHVVCAEMTQEFLEFSQAQATICPPPSKSMNFPV